MRKVVLATGEIYHVFNRGIEKRPTFIDKREYERAFSSLDFYRFEKPSLGLAQALRLDLEKRDFFFSQLKTKARELVEIICYCFMPNHFHFLLKQVKEKGIKIFLSNFSNSYTRYFNTKHRRIGPLFQGTFKAVRIEDDDQLKHISRYIHLNPVSSFVVTEGQLETYPWSSFPEFLDIDKDGICRKEIVLDLFSSKEKYRDFVFDQIDYAKKLESIKHLVLE